MFVCPRSTKCQRHLLSQGGPRILGVKILVTFCGGNKCHTNVENNHISSFMVQGPRSLLPHHSHGQGMCTRVGEPSQLGMCTANHFSPFIKTSRTTPVLNHKTERLLLEFATQYFVVTQAERAQRCRVTMMHFSALIQILGSNVQQNSDHMRCSCAHIEHKHKIKSASWFRTKRAYFFCLQNK